MQYSFKYDIILLYYRLLCTCIIMTLPSIYTFKIITCRTTTANTLFSLVIPESGDNSIEYKVLVMCGPNLCLAVKVILLHFLICSCQSVLLLLKIRLSFKIKCTEAERASRLMYFVQLSAQKNPRNYITHLLYFWDKIMLIMVTH